METEATMADDRLRSDEGAGAWVTTSPFIPRPEEVLDVDAILGEVGSLWRALETRCVAGCCGLDAFDFSADAVRGVIALEEREPLGAKLADIERRIVGGPATHIKSERLGVRCARGEIVEVLEELRRALA